MLGTLHEVGDGLRVGLRLTRPSDAPRVRAFLERLGHTVQTVENGYTVTYARLPLRQRRAA